MTGIEDYLTLTETARELRLTTRRVRQLVDEQSLRPVVTRLGMLFDPEEIKAIVHERERAKPDYVPTMEEIMAEKDVDKWALMLADRILSGYSLSA